MLSLFEVIFSNAMMSPFLMILLILLLLILIIVGGIVVFPIVIPSWVSATAQNEESKQGAFLHFPSPFLFLLYLRHFMVSKIKLFLYT